ncbi:MAG: ABC transporter permease [Proteobacteria bacterium]|nr:MAG: ABC transporter permease [Pseudomonadota bacterium]
MTMLNLIRPFGIDIFCTGKKFLIYNMVGRNLKVKYRRSVLGVFWTLLSPLSLVGIYYFAFKVVMKVETPHYLAYLVSGILPWAFFSQTVVEGMESISQNSALISKIPVPLQAFPLIAVVTNLVTLLLAVPIMLGVSLLSGAPVGPSLILLPVILMTIALTCYGVAMILGLLYVFLQDLKHITSLVMQLWFYATPVLYHVEMVPEKYRWAIYLNPVGTAFVSIHQILSEGIWPSPVDFGVSLAWSLFIIGIALVTFKAVNIG